MKQKKVPMNEERIEKMLREISILLSWQFMAAFFLQTGFYETSAKIVPVATAFINSYGSKQDKEMLKKIPDLIKVDIKRRSEKRKGVSVEMEADEATKKWVGGLLEDIGRRLGKQE